MKDVCSIKMSQDEICYACALYLEANHVVDVEDLENNCKMMFLRDADTGEYELNIVLDESEILDEEMNEDDEIIFGDDQCACGCGCDEDGCCEEIESPAINNYMNVTINIANDADIVKIAQAIEDEATRLGMTLGV